MSKFPSKEMIVDAVINGTVKAVENFLFWTNDRLFLSHGPDKMISIHIAQEIATIENAPEIFIDASISDILRCSLPNRDEYAEFMHSNGLTQDVFSITLDERLRHDSNNDSISKVIIKVNNGVRNPKLEYLEQIEVICKMLDSDTSLEYGIFSFYSDVSSDARKNLNKRIPELIKSFDAVVNKFPSLVSSFRGTDIVKIKDKGEWSVGCYVIEPN